jgi:lipid A 3-O-deacylase
MKKIILSVLCALLATTPAAAGEVFGGVYVHNVDTPLTLGGSPEGGIDLQLGLRANPIASVFRIEPYVFGALNSKGDTGYAAVGISRKFGDRFYIRPGLGLALHNGSTANVEDPDNDEIEFGSRLLFAPEIGVGTRINDRLTIEASWVHLSHATIFSGQNPGIDNIGARLNLNL